MNKQELIEEIKQRRSRLRPCGEGSIATVSDAVFSQCLGLVEQLDSPPAMTQSQQVDFGGGDIWTVTIHNGETTITDATGFVRHRSNCHESTAVHLAMSIKWRSDAPAMTWQATPTHDCEAFVEAMDGARRVVKRMGDWWYSCGNALYLLGDRFVCPIPTPPVLPALPKRGDA